MPPVASSQTQALDVIVGLLPALEERDAVGGRFFDRLCQALCQLTSLERAGLLLYDDVRRLVLPVGSHGVRRELLAQIHGTLEETPIAQVALAEDRVVEVSGDLERHLPARYAGFAGGTVVCIPVSAAGRWLGVIFADRGGGRFELDEEERQTTHAFGKAAALAASTRLGVVQKMRTRALTARLDLARELHERVVQRLFGVSLALGSEHELTADERRRCAAEIQEALADLRETMARPPTRPAFDTGATLREELDRLGGHYERLPLRVEWEEGARVPAEQEPLAQSLLAEALRNCDRHARPTRVEVRVAEEGGAFLLEVRNDGASPGAAGTSGSRMGLHLAALEAIQGGGMLEFGPHGGDEWRVRLALPGRDGGAGGGPSR